MGEVALLIARATVGGLLAGHGAQKLFGWFGGSGLKGTAGMMESLGLRPGATWAPVAALSEFGGGLLTALGLLNPLGPIAIIAAMSMATVKVHRGKPIWATAGGAELPVTNMAVALAIALAGSGRYSLDAALGLRVPPALGAVAALAALAGVATGAVAPATRPAAQASEGAA
jgi:putative oxidoreductase